MCEYCESPYKSLVYLKPLELTSFVDNTGRMWLRHYYKNKDVTFAAFNTMNFCPMCGRKFSEAK